MADQYVPPRPAQACERFTEGQEFVVESDSEPPPGFCDWAWTDLIKSLRILLEGKDHGPSTNRVVLACCTDGYRPVVFKLEEIKD